MMKLLNKKQKNNGGFSLVELIVVIAIMVVLVAVLAPLFTRYIENSRKSTDVSTANSIAEAVVADAADGKITTKKEKVEVTGTNVTTDASYISGIQSKPEVSGTAPTNGSKKGDSFYYSYDPADNVCHVYAGSGSLDLTNSDDVDKYKEDR